MPNIVHVPKAVKVLEYIVYILLLCFVIPIKIDPHDIEYKNYLEQFNKSYDSEETYKKGFDAFKRSMEWIKDRNGNRTNTSALYGLTKFSDLPILDFVKNYLVHNYSKYSEKVSNKLSSINEKPAKNVKLPLKIDWREKNVVSKVHNQGTCGACWALAAIQMTESINAIKTGKLETLSVQQMIDCAKYNDGCSGGDLYFLFQWLKEENVTIVTEEEYPTELVDGECKNTTSTGINIKDFQCGNFVNSEELIIELLANYGPVAVAINALSWQNYVSGVIQFHCDGNPLNLNHAVQIVGYDMTANVPYYIVRNSWGEDFGDDGYLYLAIGSNICGLAEEVCIVEL